MARTATARSLTNLSWLEDLSFEQLNKLISAAQAQLASKRQEAKDQLRRELVAKAQLLGVHPSELLPAQRPRGTSVGKVKPKYRDPRDPTQTWSGRGRLPRWLQERVKAGENKDDYLIR
jgi:DNA-binding protein H-NS